MKKLCMLSLLATVVVLQLQAVVIRVEGQKDFNSLMSLVNNAVSKGEKSITVEFHPQGYYYFAENHLDITNRQWGGVSLTIHGNGATLASVGKNYSNGQAYLGVFSVDKGFVNFKHGDAPFWNDLLQADGQIDVVNKQTKLCRLTSLDDIDDLPANRCRNVYINVTQWFKSSVYKVNYIKDNEIYFTAGDLAFNQGRDCYSVNLDYGFGQKHPRFRLCNASLAQKDLMSVAGNKIRTPQGIDSIHESYATRFLNISNSTLEKVSITGLQFVGNKNAKTALIQVASCKMDTFRISNCDFNALQSTIVKADTTNNVVVDKCRFKDCYREGIYLTCCANAKVENNSFDDMGLAINNNFCIRVAGKNMKIANNELKNYGYGGIAVGTWWGSPKRMQNTGVVENNLLYYTDDYMSQWAKHSLMDSGAIYIYTQCDDIHVRYNFINNYNGAYLNRGIFCDDGALNFKIYSNIITNITNSYSIDSRRSLGIETSAKTHTKVVNRNNYVYNNLVSAPIRLEGRDKNANCHLGTNIVLGKTNKVKQECSFVNLQSEGNFLNIDQWSVANKRLVIPQSREAVVRKMRDFKAIAIWIAVSKPKSGK